MQTYSDREQISGCQGGRWGEVGGGTIKEHMETSGGDEQWWFHRCINMSKLIKLYPLNMCSSLSINYASIKLFMILIDSLPLCYELCQTLANRILRNAPPWRAPSGEGTLLSFLDYLPLCRLASCKWQDSWPLTSQFSHLIAYINKQREIGYPKF